MWNEAGAKKYAQTRRQERTQRRSLQSTQKHGLPRKIEKRPCTDNMESQKKPDLDIRARPLSGRRILVTRAPHQASELADRIRALGAKPVLLPTIEIAPPASFAALDAALSALSTFDLICFTSANAVIAFADRAQRLGLTPAPQRIAAVGPSTAHALAAVKLHADVIPPVFTAESLAETLRSSAAGRNILVVLAEAAPPTLHDALASAGARVTIAHAYSNRIPTASLAAARDLFQNSAAPLDAVAFTSASTARNLAALLAASSIALPPAIMRASIGPVTSRALAELNLPPHVEANEATIPALVEVIAAHFKSMC